MVKSIKFSLLIIIIIGIIAGLIKFIIDTPNQIVYPDEYIWIAKSKNFYQDFFIEKTFNNELWTRFPAYDQPTMGFFIYGFTTHLTSGLNNVLNGTYISQSEYGNQFYQRRFSPIEIPNESTKLLDNQVYEIIVKNRYSTVIFGIGCVIMIFLISKIIFNICTAIVASVLLYFNPLFYRTSHIVDTDVVLLFFLLLSLYLLLIWKKELVHLSGNYLNRPVNSIRLYIYSILIGITSALSFDTKLNGVLVVLFISFSQILTVAWLLLRPNKNYSFIIKHSVILLISNLVITFGLFTLLNPYTWGNPLRQILNMFVFRENHTLAMMRQIPNEAVFTPWERGKMILKCTLISKDFPYTMHNCDTDNVLSLVIFIIGLIYSINKFVTMKVNRNTIAKSFRIGLIYSESNISLIILLIWFCLTFIAMLFYLMLDWDRYFLPIIPYIIIIQSAGATWIYSLVFKYFYFVKR